MSKDTPRSNTSQDSARSCWTYFGALLATALCAGFAAHASAETSNGNDFALSYAEAKGPAAKAKELEGAKGRPHYFRYLQIMEIEPATENGHEGFKITAFEPSSYLDVKFTLVMPVSVKMLKEDPASKRGDAIAVTGRVVDVQGNAIFLESPIMRHKDRLSPAMGKELLGDINPGAIFYSYTEGPRPVQLEFRDRDLLVNRDEILAKSGPKGWAAFLEGEIAKRKAARAAAAKEGGNH